MQWIGLFSLSANFKKKIVTPLLHKYSSLNLVNIHRTLSLRYMQEGFLVFNQGCLKLTIARVS